MIRSSRITAYPQAMPPPANGSAMQPPVDSQVFWPKTCLFGDLGKCRRTDLFFVVEAECEIRFTQHAEASDETRPASQASIQDVTRRRRPFWPSLRAKSSRGEEHFQRAGDVLTALDHVGQYLKGYRLDLSDGLVFRAAVSHYARQVRNRSQDSTVIPAFDFDSDWLDLHHRYFHLTRMGSDWDGCIEDYLRQHEASSPASEYFRFYGLQLEHMEVENDSPFRDTSVDASGTM